MNFSFQSGIDVDGASLTPASSTFLHSPKTYVQLKQVLQDLKNSNEFSKCTKVQADFFMSIQWRTIKKSIFYSFYMSKITQFFLEPCISLAEATQELLQPTAFLCFPIVLCAWRRSVSEQYRRKIKINVVLELSNRLLPLNVFAFHFML